MELHIVNPDPRYPKAELIAPTRQGYLYIAATVRHGSIPFVFPNIRRRRLINQLKKLAADMKHVGAVARATVFRAVVMPPTRQFSEYLKKRGERFPVADYDVMVLIEALTPAAIAEIRAAPAFGALMEVIRNAASHVYQMEAYNARRINSFDTKGHGLFLFNHFVADDAGIMLRLWDYLAGWYAVETGLGNSVAMMPINGDKPGYTVVNWARWDVPLLKHFWHQLSKKSFRSYVLANLEENQAAAMPVYCRLA